MNISHLLFVVATFVLIIAACSPGFHTPPGPTAIPPIPVSPTGAAEAYPLNTPSPPAVPTATKPQALRFSDFYPGDASTVTRIIVTSTNGQRYVVEGRAIAAFLDLMDSLIFSRLPVQVAPHLPYQYQVDLYQGEEPTLQMDFQGGMVGIHRVYYSLDTDVGEYLAGLVQDAPQLVTYYRLRLELSTTARAARVTAHTQFTRFLVTVRQMGTQGDPARHGANVHSVWVGQEEGSDHVTVTADYVVTSRGLLFQPVPSRFEQRDEGTSVLRVYNVGGEEPELLQEVHHSGATPLDFSLDLGVLAGRPPLEGQIPARPQKMLWAYYYPWYYADGWDTAILQDQPLMGYYGSDSRAAIEQHIAQAQGAGIDGFISSWWGPGSYTDENLPTLLDVAQERNFRVMINFELLGDAGQPRPEVEILAWLRYAMSEYGDHPAYMRVDDKPAFVIWASSTVSNDTWGNIRTQLRAEGLDAFLLAQFAGEWPTLDSLDLFDGLYQYNILNVMHSNDQVDMLCRVYASTGRAVRYHPLLMDTPTLRLWAATVQPGYDDHLIPGRTTPILDRQDGALYRATFDAALQSDPDWIFITSWNEWWEHTYIEPSELYGDQYVQITRVCAERWKNGGGEQ
ncbi:MAG: glycoside hydrolase family 99-like domain-containing protein [Chloroflexi bacterium]|nr:glycoside hydrolase family 99-like domain-containing protein [Chloroflexota bacterium]MBU1748985.1 glycoside hydrolase family 99-like domain-containing protein [Chloroflexota bacterium]MBU1879913.1 glycoside hydrolase family 99-like domain-containing protein [Chloroflexota bacterium]